VAGDVFIMGFLLLAFFKKLRPLTKKSCALLIAIIGLQSCSDQTTLSLVPMPLPKGDAPWQVISAQELRIYREVINFNDGLITIDERALYVTVSGQFVFRNGDPITYLSQYLYWNEQGQIISSTHNKIRPSAVFKIKGKPMPDNTKMILRLPLQKARSDWQNQQGKVQ
jgi:hypothetical protein